MLQDKNMGLLEQLKALIEDWDGTQERRYCHLANASALLFDFFENINWLGFYLTIPGSKALLLGPFQGKVACTDISYKSGVCGSAASLKQTVRVADVHTFDGHIACDSESRSEVVVPLMDSQGTVVGVLDVDSPLLDRFSDHDQQLLEKVAKIISSMLWY